MMRLKGSAVLIALSIGLILSATVFAAAAVISMRSQSLLKSIEGNVAYHAAVSGIEDGLLRYKYAASEGKAEEVFVDFGDKNISVDPKVQYGLKIINESVGAPMVSSYYGSWPNVDLSKASKLDADDTIDLNLSKIGEGGGKLSAINIYFSAPNYMDGGESKKVSNAFTALNYRLVNTANQDAQMQIISEKTNTQIDAKMISVDKVNMCESLSSCHLKIKPQVVSRSLAFNPETKKLIGAGSDKQGKFIYYVLEAKFDGNISINDNAKVGTIRIISVGKTGRTSRKVETIIDSSTGANLGLFDFGIYCGNQCTGT